MIRITRNNSELELYPDTSFDLELNSWLFSDSDTLLGSFTHEFRFPLSPLNIAFLEYRHLAEQPYREIEVFAVLSNALTMSCNLAYEIEGKDGLGFLKFEHAKVNAQIKNVKLSELLTEVVYLGRNPAQAASIMEDMVRAEIGHYPIVFGPVYNPEFVEKDFILEREDIEGLPASTFILYTRNDTINPWGKRQDGSRGFLYNTTTSFLDKIGPVKLNVTAINAGIINVPYVFMAYVLQQIMDYLGFGIESQWFFDPEIQCRVIYNTQALTSFTETTQANPVISVKIAEHVPDMTIAEYIKAIRKYYALNIDFDALRGTVSIIPFKTIEISNDYVDWREYQTLDPVRIGRPSGQGWKVKFEEDSADKLYKELNPVTEFLIGDGEQTYSVPLATLPMVRQKNETTGALWTIPNSKQPGNLRGRFYAKSENFSDTFPPKNDIKLRLLAFRGMQPDLEGNVYPLITSEIYDTKGNKVGLLSDNPELTNSVYAQYMKPYLFFRDQSRQIQQTLLLPITALQGYKLSKKVGLMGENRVMMRHLIQKLVVDLPAQGGFFHAKVYSYALLPGQLGTIGNNVIWLVIEFVNQRDQSEGAIYHAIADVVIRVYADDKKERTAAVSNLRVWFAMENVLTKERTEYPVDVTGSEQVVLTDTTVIYATNYDFLPNTTNAYTPKLIASSTYSIIE
ncbi:hypothetical protein [Runella sp.]|uniref:hypothetical protein n=1 Tax=Runella sp. TaxID=1960881 RepID=UPI003D0C3EDC